MLNLLAHSRSLLRHGSRTPLTSRRPKHTRATKMENATGVNPETMEKFLQMTETNQLGFDPWGQPIPTLDLHVPTPWSALPKDASLRTRLKFTRLGLENQISNTVAMFRLAKSHSLPWNPTASPYSLQIFRATSTKPNTWLEPLRDIALESYKLINTAVAANDVHVIRALTHGAYRKRMAARMKTLHPNVANKSSTSSKKAIPRSAHIWRLHSLASPVRCVSLRCVQGHFGRNDPPFGTRWTVQACLKFDTWQSLEVLSPSSSLSLEPKRVLEYLVFQKMMWYDGPWRVMDQLWEGVLGENTGIRT